MTKTATPNTAPGVPDLKQSEVESAKKDGALDYIKNGAKAAMAGDTGTTGDLDAAEDRAKYQVAADLNTTFIAPLLDLPVETLTNRLTGKPKEGEDHIDFEVAKGLLHLERAGRNRTGYVKALMAAIGVKDVSLVTSAGPSYTNDESSITEL